MAKKPVETVSGGSETKPGIQGGGPFTEVKRNDVKKPGATVKDPLGSTTQKGGQGDGPLF